MQLSDAFFGDRLQNGWPYATGPLSVLSVCLPVLSVTFVHCGQTVGRIKMKLGTQVGLCPGHIVLDGDPAPLPQRGTAPQFSAHIYCSQMAGWIKMSLGMEVGLSRGDFVLDGIPLYLPKNGGNFRPISIVVKRMQYRCMHQDATCC